MMIRKAVKKFLRTFDYFGVPFTFKYKSEEKYRTAIGGVCFLLFLTLSVAYGLLMGIPIIRRERMAVTEYEIQTLNKEELNFKEHYSSFAVGFSTCSSIKNYTEFWDLFELELSHIETVTRDGVTTHKEIKIDFDYCHEQNFYNRLNTTFRRLGLSSFFCPKNLDYNINGYFTRDVSEYIKINLKAKSDKEEIYERIYDIFLNRCHFGVYYTDYAFDMKNFTTPVRVFLNQNFLSMKYSESLMMNVHFKMIEFDSYESFFFDTFKRRNFMSFSDYQTYSYSKGEKRFTEHTKDYNVFATIYFRASLSTEKIERKYTKLTEFAADVSSILSAILIFMFCLLSFINKFYAHQSVMNRIFQFSNKKVKRKNKDIKDIKKAMKKSVSLLEKPEEKMMCCKITFNNFLDGASESVNSDFINKKKRGGKKWSTHCSLKNINIETETTEGNENIIEKVKQKKPQGQNQFPIRYNIIELINVSFCSSCSWKKLRVKNSLFKKGLEKLFFQLDVLNYIKQMQQLEILGYSLLEPNENIILQFLSKPSISLPQKKDIYDKIRRVNDINITEANELYDAVKQLNDRPDKTNFQKRLLKITKGEVNALLKKMRHKGKI